MAKKKIVFDLETCGLNGESMIIIGEQKRGVIHIYDPEKSKAITEHGQKLVHELMEKIQEYDEKSKINTGLVDLDKILESGLSAGELGIIMAPTFDNKTMFIRDFLQRMIEKAKADGYIVMTY